MSAAGQPRVEKGDSDGEERKEERENRCQRVAVGRAELFVARWLCRGIWPGIEASFESPTRRRHCGLRPSPSRRKLPCNRFFGGALGGRAIPVAQAPAPMVPLRWVVLDSPATATRTERDTYSLLIKSWSSDLQNEHMAHPPHSRHTVFAESLVSQEVLQRAKCANAHSTEQTIYE
jgi:hypothetical protein